MGSVQPSRTEELPSHSGSGGSLVQEKVIPFPGSFTYLVLCYYFRIHEKYENIQEALSQELKEKICEKEKGSEKFKGREYEY